jgi:hypothetical protein
VIRNQGGNSVTFSGLDFNLGPTEHEARGNYSVLLEFRRCVARSVLPDVSMEAIQQHTSRPRRP